LQGGTERTKDLEQTRLQKKSTSVKNGKGPWRQRRGGPQPQTEKKGKAGKKEKKEGRDQQGQKPPTKPLYKYKTNNNFPNVQKRYKRAVEDAGVVEISNFFG